MGITDTISHVFSLGPPLALATSHTEATHPTQASFPRDHLSGLLGSRCEERGEGRGMRPREGKKRRKKAIQGSAVARQPLPSTGIQDKSTVPVFQVRT